MTSIDGLPHHHRLQSIRAAVAADRRFCGLLAGGSLLHGGFDAHSDLDLVLVAEREAYEGVMADRRAIADAFGGLLAAFTGEHVGEPRLLICLYGPELLHVDLKFVAEDALDRLIERPVVLWDRHGRLAPRLDRATIAWPDRDAAWFEERFWIWVHYAATKIARGELLEARGMFGFIADQVLGPLFRLRAGKPQRGVRRLEEALPEAASAIAATLAAGDRGEAKASLEAAMGIYRALTADERGMNMALRDAVTAFVEKL